MTKKSSYQEISQEQVIEISSEYFDDRKAWISSQEIPTAVLVAGQPGAGKSRLAKTVRSFLKNQGGYIHIDADRMREELPTNGVAYPSAVTQKDAGRLVAALRKQVVSDHINFLEEGTFRDAQNVAAFTDALKNQGYRVELRVVSASPEESLLGIYERYESQISAGSENPRILEESYHQVAFEGFCNTVKERERFFDRVQVVNRQNEILYDSQHPLPGQTAYSALLEGHVLDTDRLNKLKAGWNNVYEIALNRKEPDSDFLLKISNNRSRVADLTIAGTDISTNNTANIQMVREESSLPDSMLYRLENLRIAQEDYQAGLEGFWQEEKMSRVRDKIREYAEENGMSEQDVIAGINKDTDMNLSEISQVFNEAYENSPAAKTAKEKMDHALSDWKDSYSSLTEDFGYGDADNSDYRRAFGQYENSREDMEEATASVPKTPEEETNHFDQMKEFLQQMQEKIKELAEKLVNAVKRFFGKGEENERSPEP